MTSYKKLFFVKISKMEFDNFYHLEHSDSCCHAHNISGFFRCVISNPGVYIESRTGPFYLIQKGWLFHIRIQV